MRYSVSTDANLSPLYYTILAKSLARLTLLSAAHLVFVENGALEKGVPSTIQHALFIWESEFGLGNRIARIGASLDDITQLYVCLLSNFTRIADLRQRLIESPNKALLAHAYMCDRVMATMLNAMNAHRNNIHLIIQRCKEELETCTRLRWASERSRREAERIMKNGATADNDNNNPIFLQYRNRGALLREIEQRLRDVVQGQPTLFSTARKPWSDYVDPCLAAQTVDVTNSKNNSNGSDKTSQGENANDNGNKHKNMSMPIQEEHDSRMQDESKHSSEKTAGKKTGSNERDPNHSPIPMALALGREEPVQQLKTPVGNSSHKSLADADVGRASASASGSKGNSDEVVVVPETPERESAERHVAMQTQVSSPRKRKRARIATDSVPRLVRSLHPAVDLSALVSLQAYGDVADPSQSPHVGRLRGLSQLPSRSQSQPHDDKAVNDDNNQNTVNVERIDGNVGGRRSNMVENQDSPRLNDVENEEQGRQKVLTQKQGNQAGGEGDEGSASGSGWDKIMPVVPSRVVAQEGQSTKRRDCNNNAGEGPGSQKSPVPCHGEDKEGNGKCKE